MPRPVRAPGRTSEDRDSDRPSFRPNRRNTDTEIIALREKDHTFAYIATSLGLKRATDAHDAFVRAMRGLPDEQRSEVVGRESLRLDRLENRIRTRDIKDPLKMTRRLEALQSMRDLLR